MVEKAKRTVRKAPAANKEPTARKAPAKAASAKARAKPAPKAKEVLRVDAAAPKVDAARAPTARAAAETPVQALEPEVPAAHAPPAEETALPAEPGALPSPSSAPAAAGQAEGSFLRPANRARGGATLPEQFLMLVHEPGWDSRNERFPDGFGMPLAGAMLLDLALHGELRLQADRFQVKDVADPTYAAIVHELRRTSGKAADQALFALARKASRLAEPFKDRLAGQGLFHVERRRALLVLPRTGIEVRDGAALERFRQRVMRGLAGGGPLDAKEILLLGLIDAAGLLGQFVPSTALAYNHKRIQGLLAGRDRLDYRMDQGLRALQRDLLEFVLRAVKRSGVTA